MGDVTPLASLSPVMKYLEFCRRRIRNTKVRAVTLTTVSTVCNDENNSTPVEESQRFGGGGGGGGAGGRLSRMTRRTFRRAGSPGRRRRAAARQPGAYLAAVEEEEEATGGTTAAMAINCAEVSNDNDNDILFITNLYLSSIDKIHSMVLYKEYLLYIVARSWMEDPILNFSDYYNIK